MRPDETSHSPNHTGCKHGCSKGDRGSDTTRSCRNGARESSPRSGLAPSSRGELDVVTALQLCERQQQLLEEAAHRLDRLGALASAILDNATFDPLATERSYRQLVEALGQLAGRHYEGLPIFSASSFAVTLDGDGNKLIVSGIHLTTRLFGKLSQVTLHDAATAGEVLRLVKNIDQCLLLDHALIQETVSRLAFLGKRLDSLKETVLRAM